MSFNRNQTDRLIFNGHNLSTLVSCEVQRPILPPIEVKTAAIPGRTDELVKSVKRLPYDLPIKVHLRSDNRYSIKDVRRQLAKALWADEPKALYLPDDPTRYLLAIVTGNTMLDELTDDTPETTVNFHIVDPDFFGKKRMVRLGVDDNQLLCGRVNAGGNLPSYPIIAISIKEEISDFSIWCFHFGDAGIYAEDNISFYQTFQPGTTLVIDMKNECVLRNGYQVPVDILSTFFSISDIVEINTNLASSAAEVRVEWRERWL